MFCNVFPPELENEITNFQFTSEHILRRFQHLCFAFVLFGRLTDRRLGVHLSVARDGAAT